MSWERDHQGNYSGGLTNGASSSEQHSAGVNQYDSLGSAYEKVEAHRRSQQSSSVYNAGFNTSSTSPSYIAPAYYGGGVNRSIGLKGLGNLLAIAAIAALSFFVYSSSRISVQPDRFLAILAMPYVGKLDANGLRTLSDMRQSHAKYILSPVFVDGAPLMDIWKLCKVKNCLQPDLAAFDAFKQYAKQPERYENDLCLLHGAEKAPQFAPTWAIDRKSIARGSAFCMQTNFRETAQKIAEHNRGSFWYSGAIAVIGISLLLFFNFRKTKTHLK
jgi:hypothetical protein